MVVLNPPRLLKRRPEPPTLIPATNRPLPTRWAVNLSITLVVHQEIHKVNIWALWAKINNTKCPEVPNFPTKSSSSSNRTREPCSIAINSRCSIRWVISRWHFTTIKAQMDVIDPAKHIQFVKRERNTKLIRFYIDI